MSREESKRAIQEKTAQMSEEFAKDMSTILAGYKDQAERICRELNELGLPWDHAMFVLKANMQKAGIFMLSQLFEDE